MRGQRWKRAEREIAAVLGGSRLPNNGAGQPDVRTILVSGVRLAVQVKTTKQLPAWLTAAIDQARYDATGDELPVVVLNEVRQGVKARRLFVLDQDAWGQLTAGDISQQRAHVTDETPKKGAPCRSN
jgi:hypothetical protein